MLRIGINGLGRIGRCAIRALYEYAPDIKLVALNTPAEASTVCHLLKYDSVHGKFNKEVESRNNSLIIDNEEIPSYNKRTPEEIPWRHHRVDIVIESTGVFKEKHQVLGHIKAGAQKILISAPAEQVDRTIIYGVNHTTLTTEDQIVSVGSCTTNCLAPILHVLHQAFSVKSAFMTTVHAYTNDQNLVDNNHKDLQRARACHLSMIPTATGAAKTIGKILPELEGKVKATAIRVPIPNVSLIDMVFLSNPTSVEQINEVMCKASQGELKGVLAICKEPLVSIDFNHTLPSAIFDLSATYSLPENLSRVMAWYDNEWAFVARMLDVIRLMK